MPVASLSRAFALLLLAWIVSAGPACSPAERTHPDIVFVLADDLGWRDVSYHGGDIATPNIDRLAAEGVRLEALYALPVCTPSRIALLTGRHPMRMGLQEDVLRPWSQRGMPLSERTLAQALREAGYATRMVGKWHLGHHAPEYLPQQRGFDHHYGSYCGLIDYETHERLGALDWHRDGSGVRESGHTTNLIADEAVRILGERAPDQPLFLYVAFNAPHAPNQPPAECASEYASLEPPVRRGYAAQVACLDRAIGRILAAVDASNTIVVFMSDNGGDATYGADNRPLRGEKGTLYEGGVRVPALVRWTGHLKPRTVLDTLHAVDWYPTLLNQAGAVLAQPLPIDGLDLWPALARGERIAREDVLLNAWPEGGALIAGTSKLVASGLAPDGTASTDARVELYDLASDPSEEHDLAAAQPERVRALLDRLQTYMRQSQASAGGELDARPPGFRPPQVWGE